jgi:hypothetical protein
VEKTIRTMLVAVTLSAWADNRADAMQICSWLVESNQPDDVRQLDLWLQSDTDVDFLIKVDGAGIVDGSGKSNSPVTATYTLTAGKAEKAWSFGSTLEVPGAIDETIELHKVPADIFSDTPTPLLAKFGFQRKIPSNEKTPPDTLAKKQCATLK